MQRDNLFKNIKSIRKTIGMTQQELALKTGYSGKSMISRLEAGKVDPSHSKIYKLADALGVTYADLMGWEAPEDDGSAAPRSVAIPVYDDFFPNNPSKQEKHIISYELIPASWTGEYFALRLKDNAELPDFSPGDILIFRKQETAKNGACVLALNSRKKVVLHRFVKTKRYSFLLPLKEDPATVRVADKSAFSDPFQILGCVVETRRRSC